jgi:uncharacterized membrane protein (DUF373 family)
MQQSTEVWATARERLTRGAGIAEIILLGLVGFALLVAALIAVLQGIYWFGHAIVAGDYADGLVFLLDRMLITIMIVEILDTLRISISSRKVQCQPFLVVGMIAATRQILMITLKSSVNPGAGGLPEAFDLIGLVVVIIGLAGSIAILKKCDVA